MRKAYLLKILGILGASFWIFVAAFGGLENPWVIVAPLAVASFIISRGYVTEKYGKYEMLALVCGTVLITILWYLVFVILSVVNYL